MFANVMHWLSQTKTASKFPIGNEVDNLNVKALQFQIVYELFGTKSTD